VVSAAHDPAMTDLLVELSDTLVADTDAERLLHRISERCLRVLDVEEAGILVADDRGELRLLAAAPEYAARMAMFEDSSGPASWCFVTGMALVDPDLDRADPRWPAFARQARQAGFRSVSAVPMKVRGEFIGVLSVLRHRAGDFTEEELRLTQALANVATVGLLLQRDVEYRSVLAAQAQRVLTGRVAVERARGILAELLDIDIDAALSELRRHAERTGRSLSAAALELVDYLPLAARAADSGPGPLVHPVTVAALPLLRKSVRRRLMAAGLSVSAADHFTLAVHEAAVNAAEHGGGGRLWLWRHDADLWCEISDDGAGIPADFPGRTEAPRPGDPEHAGLWLIRRICPDMQLTTGPGGTRLLLRCQVPAESGAGG
jgi:GAF domain-containing protein/anti-sigma regulatory factor (Ser/Thr protein kinase)